MARAWEYRAHAAYIIEQPVLNDLHRKFTWLADIWGLSPLAFVLCFEGEDIRETLSRFVLGRPNPTPQDRDVGFYMASAARRGGTFPSVFLVGSLPCHCIVYVWINLNRFALLPLEYACPFHELRCWTPEILVMQGYRSDCSKYLQISRFFKRLVAFLDGWCRCR